MNCRIVSSKLSEYVDQELGGHDMALIRNHLCQCRCCAKEHEELLCLKRRIGAMPISEPAAGFEARLRKAVCAAAEAPKARPTHTWRAAIVTAVAAVGVFLLALELIPDPVPSQANHSHTTTDWATDQTFETARDPFVGISVAPVSHSGR